MEFKRFYADASAAHVTQMGDKRECEALRPELVAPGGTKAPG
jgi:hypothetical protein